ncbi:MAG: TIM-barrel domain-containing protein, partial [Candidatus Thiodiazotropha sp.]
LNMGLCGFPIIGCDVGGFAQSHTEKYQHTQEHLMVRWVQASSLLPWFRDHYAKLQYGGKKYQELYAFEWCYNGRKFSDIMNDFVKMRVRFHHVLYTGMYNFCKTGVPPVKPTCLYEGGSKRSNVMKGFTSCQDSQYFVGDCTIMVCPAMEDENCGALEDQSSGNYPAVIHDHPVWFPTERKWFPYDARYDGPCDPGNGFNYTQGTYGFYLGTGAAHKFTVPLENMPVFMKEGAIIPTRITADGSNKKNIQQLDKDGEPFVFDIWPGAEYSTYECYFDDGGRTKNAELKGEYSLVKVQQRSEGGVWQISFSSEYNKYLLPTFLYIRLRAAVSGPISDSQSRSYSGCSTLPDLFQEKGPACYYDTGKKEQWIKVFSDKLDGLTISKKGTYDIKPLIFPDA